MSNFRTGALAESTEAEHDAYLDALAKAILDSRQIIDTYDIVMLLLLAALSLGHWLQQHSRRRRTEQTKAKAERVPFLPRKTPLYRQWRVRRAVSAWLTYQPAAVPVIGRALPSNATSVLVLAWYGLMVGYHFYRLPLRWDMFLCFGSRAGDLFVVNLPLLYLLAAKNQPIKWLTGYSYETLNILHRRVGEYMCFLGAVHFLSMVTWRFYVEDAWAREGGDDGLAFFLHPIVVKGLVTLSSYGLLYLTSLASFRQRWYETFLASHVVLQLVALVGLFLHFYTSRPYVVASLTVLMLDRLVWRLWVKSATMKAHVELLEDGETVSVSANWIMATNESPRPWYYYPSILDGWWPAAHVFITVPELGRTHALQAHPFTIASAAPQPPQACFNLLIRAQDGFTRDLLRRAEAGPCDMTVQISGPYGSRHALDLLRAVDVAVVVAGGSGIAVAFPLLWALLHEHDTAEGKRKPADSDPDPDPEDDGGRVGRPRRTKKFHLVWVTRDRSHRAWIPKYQLDHLVDRGLDLVVPDPTAEAGRPDVVGLVRRCIDDAPVGDQVGVVVSGPDPLNRSVRNVCSRAISEGADVSVLVEKFGW